MLSPLAEQYTLTVFQYPAIIHQEQMVALPYEEELVKKRFEEIKIQFKATDGTKRHAHIRSAFKRHTEEI